VRIHFVTVWRTFAGAMGFPQTHRHAIVILRFLQTLIRYHHEISTNARPL